MNVKKIIAKREIQWLFLTLLAFAIGLWNINLPGVYFDCAITDYLATIQIHNSLGNETATMAHVGIPLLGGVYHGSLSMWVQLLILQFVEGSPISLRIPYVCYLLIIAFIIYEIVMLLCKNNATAFGGSCIFLTNSAVFSITRTQYDIMLPGAIFFLLMILFLFKNWNVLHTRSAEAYQKAYIVAFLLGLSFYGYFCFIFFFPFIVISLYRWNRTFKTIWSLTLGFVCGCTPYFIGYADSLFTNIFGAKLFTVIVLVGFMIGLFLFISIPSYHLLMKKEISKKITVIYIVIVVLGFLTMCICSIKIGPLVYEKFSNASVNVMGNSIPIKIRALLFFKYAFSLMSGNSAEKMMVGVISSVFTKVFIIMFIISVCFILVGKFFRKFRKDVILQDKMIYVIGLFFSYYICSFPLISRMQPQHMVPLFCLSFIVFLVEGYQIFIYCRKSKLGQRMLYIVLATLILGNLWDCYKLQENLKETKGVGSYSIEITNFAITARKNQKEDIQETYCFMEPGFLPNFIYLTDNEVPIIIMYDVSGEIDMDKVNLAQYCSGYKLNFIMRNEQFLDDIYQHFGRENVVVANRYDSVGNLVYISAQLIV